MARMTDCLREWTVYGSYIFTNFTYWSFFASHLVIESVLVNKHFVGSIICKIEEIMYIRLFPKQEIIVKINEVSGKTWNTVKVHLDSHWIKSGKIFNILENFFMSDHFYPWILCIQPGWNLTICYNINVSDKRCKLFERSQ